MAQPAVTLIDQQEVLDRANVVNVEGPAEEARVRELHRAYLAGVNFHPDALAALNAAEQDRPLATALVQALVATPCRAPGVSGRRDRGRRNPPAGAAGGDAGRIDCPGRDRAGDPRLRRQR